MSSWLLESCLLHLRVKGTADTNSASYTPLIPDLSICKSEVPGTLRKLFLHLLIRPLIYRFQRRDQCLSPVRKGILHRWRYRTVPLHYTINRKSAHRHYGDERCPTAHSRKSPSETPPETMSQTGSRTLQQTISEGLRTILLSLQSLRGI